MEGVPADPAGAPRRALPTPAAAARAAAAVVPTAAYAWFASGTTPFTWMADVTTAVPMVAMVVAVLAQRTRPEGPWRRIPSEDPPSGGTPLPWLSVVLLLVLTEVASLFGGTRSTHPTLSSLTDTIFQWHATKAAVYFVWLSLSWYFLRR
ncbi:MAG: hypothetical protein ACRDYZ_01990 [Acidimicrobiales bacterium]